MKAYDIQALREKYSLVPRTLVFIYRNEEILFIRKTKKNSFDCGKINGIGGHIEIGEEPFESAKREISEETQMEIRNLLLTAMVFINIGDNPGILMFLFRADYANGEIMDSVEGDLLWLNRKDVQENKLILFDIPLLLDICDKHENGSPPLILKYDYDDRGEFLIEKKTL